MRTPDASTTALQGQRWTQLKVTLGGVDLTAYDGRNWIVSVDWGTDVDAPLGQCTIGLHPEERWLRWAPLVEDSKINAVSPVLTLGALVVVSVSEAVTRAAADAGAPGWHEVFRGRVTELDWATNPIQIRCADMAVELADAWLMRERWYARAHRPEGVLVWAPDLDVRVGDYCIESKGTALSAAWRCLTAGTTGGAEPAWTDATVTDGTAEWEQIAIGSGVWTTSAAYEVGDFVASRRYVATIWAASTTYALNDTVIRLADPLTEHRYLCVQAGTSGSTQPDWTTLAVGQELADGTCRWLRLTDDRANNADLDRFMCCVAGTSASDYGYEPAWPEVDGLTCSEATGVRWTKVPLTADGLTPIEAVLAGMVVDATRDNDLDDPPPIHCPTSPGYWMQPFLQQPMGSLEAMRRLASQIGWTLRTRYVSYLGDHATWGKWRLVLEAPDRSATTSDVVLTEADYYGVRRGSVRLSEIRNRVEVAWLDWEHLQPDGKNPTTQRLLGEDAASIAQYGVRFMALGLGTANEVNTFAEATALVQAILSDLAQPTAEVELEAPLRWELELGDLVELSPCRYWSEAQKLAVVGLKSSVREGKARTRASLRGKPSAGVRTWLERATGPGRSGPATNTAPQAPESITVTPGPNSGAVEYKPPLTGTPPKFGAGTAQKAELHLSVTNGFTPSAATLWSVSSTLRFDVTGLRAGTTYYGRIVLVDSRGNRSAPSPQFTLEPWGQQGAQMSLSGDASVEPAAAVEYDAADVDPDSLGDRDAGTITVPADGYYRVRAEGRVIGLGSGATAGWIFKVGSATVYTGPLATVGTGDVVVAECLLALEEDDVVGCFLNVSGTATVKAGATFSVMRTLLEA